MLLIKPVSSQFLVTFRYMQVMEFTGLLIGLGGRGLFLPLGGVVRPVPRPRSHPPRMHVPDVGQCQFLAA